MVDIRVVGGGITVHLDVPERVLSLHRADVHVDKGQIASVHTTPDVYAELRGLRMPGTGITGHLALGTWRGHDTRGAVVHDFVIIEGRGPGLVVNLTNHDYSRLLIRSDDATQIATDLGSPPGF